MNEYTIPLITFLCLPNPLLPACILWTKQKPKNQIKRIPCKPSYVALRFVPCSQVCVKGGSCYWVGALSGLRLP